MTCNFRVGQKVVCIKGGSSSRTRGGWSPHTGGIYTVRGIYDGPERVDLHLEEYVHHERHPDGAELGWNAARFRPVVERGTEKGMSILRNLLNKTGKPVEVDA